MLSAFVNRKPWVAATVAFFDPLIGMLYLGRGGLALIYLAVELSIGFLLLFFLYGALIQGSQALVLVSYLPIRLIGTFHAYLLATWRAPVPVRLWYARWYTLIAVCLLLPLGAALTNLYVLRFFR